LNAVERRRRQNYTEEGTWTAARVKAAIRTGYRGAYRVAPEFRTVEHATMMNWPIDLLPTLWHNERRALQLMGLAATKLFGGVPELIKGLTNIKTGESVARSTYDQWVKDGAACIADKLNHAARAKKACHESMALAA
jgi:hypothetical protein